MILTREQINRYLRHIIMPEISGPGQKKLLESSVFLCGERVRDMAPVIYYLAAAGLGHIYCQFSDAAGFAGLLADIGDLNNDVSLELAESSRGDLHVFFGRPAFIKEKYERVCHKFTSSVVALYGGWRGGLQVFKDKDRINSFLAHLPAAQPASGAAAVQDTDAPGEIFSTCLLGALCATEIIKLALDIGETADDFICYDLLAMEFSRAGAEDLAPLLRELAVSHEHDGPVPRLADRRVLIVGAGGLGSPVAYALALAGVGTIGLVDYDNVEISNLNRQILHTLSRIGQPKVESAALFLKNIDPNISIVRHNTSLSKENVFDIMAGYDVVVDALDNFPTRFLLNDACFFAKKPLVDAGVIRFDGTCMTILNPEGPCYRCRYPDIPAPGSTPSCSEVGVLGPLPGVMGFIQAAEVVKILAGLGEILKDRIIFFEGLYANFCTLKLDRGNNCPLCGPAPTIHELQEYTFVCADDGP